MDQSPKKEGTDGGAAAKHVKTPSGKAATTQIVVIVGKRAFGPFVNVQQFGKYRPGLELVGLIQKGEEVAWYPLVSSGLDLSSSED